MDFSPKRLLAECDQTNLDIKAKVDSIIYFFMSKDLSSTELVEHVSNTQYGSPGEMDFYVKNETLSRKLSFNTANTNCY